MKMKVQAQRKFAQGAFVPPSPNPEPRRISNPPVDNGVNVINNNISATKLLDAVAFSHPGMHIHSPRVILERLTSTDYKSSSTVLKVKQSVKKTMIKSKKKDQNIVPSERVLRSMGRSSPCKSDEMPLTYHVSKKPKPRSPTNDCVICKGGTKHKSTEPCPKKIKKTKKNKEISPSDRVLRHGEQSSSESSGNQKKISQTTDIINTAYRRILQEQAEQKQKEQQQLLELRQQQQHLQLQKQQQEQLQQLKQQQEHEQLKQQQQYEQLKQQQQHEQLQQLKQQQLVLLQQQPFEKHSSSNKPAPPEPEEISSESDVQMISVTHPICDLDDVVEIPATTPPLSPMYDENIPSTSSNYLVSLPPSAPALTFNINEPIPSTSTNIPPWLRQSVAQTVAEEPFTLYLSRTESEEPFSQNLTRPESQEPFAPNLTRPESDEPFAPNLTRSESKEPFAPNLTRPESEEPFSPDLTRPESETQTDTPSVDRSQASSPMFNLYSTMTNRVPVYYPTLDEFKDPLEFYNKVAPVASKYGFCKVVPPKAFQPKCHLEGLERLEVWNQYVHRFYQRLGAGTRDLCAIRTHLASHGIHAKTPPLIDGLEVDLPKMFKVVQKYGGFNEVTRKNKWNKIAEAMNFSKLTNPEIKLDRIYLKYILPYDILRNDERITLNKNIEARWLKQSQKLYARARNPLHPKKVFRGESDSSSDEESITEVITYHIRNILVDVEDCVKSGRYMQLSAFKKINDNAERMYFPDKEVYEDLIENFYWNAVLNATDHIVVHTASVDASERDIGFSTHSGTTADHPWNLKNVRHNRANILRSLGPTVPVTAPIVHFGMIFSTNCWHRDPHGLPWIEYLHTGKSKIWYGIPEHQSEQFRKAVEKICPLYVQNKSVWLPSDILMIPPQLLSDQGIQLYREIQKPGEYMFIFPKAYTSSICTGFSISESVYFAVDTWPTIMTKIFKELRESCEPMIFSPEHLLIAMARDNRVTVPQLKQIYPEIVGMVDEELAIRSALLDLGIVEHFQGRKDVSWKSSREEECDVCRRPLYLSKVKGKFHHHGLKQICPQDAKAILKKFDDTNLVIEVMVSDTELRYIKSSAKYRIHCTYENYLASFC